METGGCTVAFFEYAQHPVAQARGIGSRRHSKSIS
jgi:hypothetical protein